MVTDLTEACERIRKSDPRIMSLILADADGTKLAHSYGPEYEKEYMESAAAIRSRAGLLAVVMMGMTQGSEDAFGKTEAIVRLHKNISVVIFSTPSRKKVITMVTTKDADVRSILPKVRPLIKGL